MRPAFRVPSYWLLALGAILCGSALAQTAKDSGIAPTAQPNDEQKQIVQPYKQPTQKQRLHTYVAQMVSPYALGSLAFVSGLHQAEHNPGEWQEGMAGFGERVASNFGTSIANASARYLLSEALQEDTLYYPCRCKGFWRRLNHAIFYTAIARRGPDGHKVLGIPQLVGPYAGSFTAVYGWYPHRYGWEAAFRMGNHGLLSLVGTNISIEFLPSILHGRARKWARRLHLANPVGAEGTP